MKDHGTTRRALLGGFVLFGGSVCWGLHAWLSPPRELRWTSEDVLRTFRPPQDVLALGRLYLERHPEEADASQLIDKIVDGRQPPPESPAALLDFLRMRVERDYEQDDVFTVEHWRLSRTEGRLWALASLGMPDS